MNKRILFKVLCLFSIVIFVSIFFIRCTGERKDTHKTSTDQFQEKLQPATLTFYFPGSEPEGIKDVLAEVEKQVKPSLNVSLDFKWIPRENYSKQINFLLDSNQPIDAFIAARDEKDDELNRFYNEGKTANLTDIFAENAPSLLGMFTKDEMQNVTYNNKLLALPQHLPQSNRMCAVIRKDIAEKYAGSGIKTVEDYIKFLGKVKENEDLSPAFCSGETIDYFCKLYGYVRTDNYLVYKLDSSNVQFKPCEQVPEYQAISDLFQDLKTKLYIDRYTLSGALDDGINPLEAINQNRTASVLADLNTIEEYTLLNAPSTMEFEFYPLNEEIPSVRSLEVNALVVSQKSKYPDRVLKFLQWVESRQTNYDLLMYGIQDKNYTIENDVIDFPADKVKFYGWDGSNVLKNINLIHPRVSVSTDFIEKCKTVSVKNILPYAIKGFVFDESSVKNIIEKRNNKYLEEKRNLIIPGADYQIDLADDVKYHKSIGVEQLVSEVELQYRKWKSASILSSQ